MASVDTRTISIYSDLEDANKVYYPGSGRRENSYEIGDQIFVRSISDRVSGVACLMTSDQLSKKGREYQIMGRSLPLAPGEKYSDEPSPGFGTAFLIGGKYLLTAGHCVTEIKEGTVLSKAEKDHLKKVRVVFGFQKVHEGQKEYSVPTRDVYKIKKVVCHKYSVHGLDFALIKLKKSVVDRSPLPLGDSDYAVGTRVYTLGHGEGLPIKCTYNAEIQASSRPSVYTYQANLGTFGGNSGSPVFDQKTGNVIGILVRGNQDYEVDARGNEVLPLQRHTATSDEMRFGFEQCVKISELAEIILSLKQKEIIYHRQERKGG